ncbi:hypothetical protein [Geodermatophilus sp. SYSU D00698]
MAGDPAAAAEPAPETAGQRFWWRVLMSFAVTGIVVSPLMATAGADVSGAVAGDRGTGVYSGGDAVAQPPAYARLTPSFGVPGTPDGFLFPGFGTTASSQRATAGTGPSAGLTGIAGSVAAATTGAAAPAAPAPAVPAAPAPAAPAPAGTAGGAPAGSGSSGGPAPSGGTTAPAAPAPPAPAAPAPVPTAPAPVPADPGGDAVGGVVGGLTDTVGGVVGGGTEAVGGLVGGATGAVGGVVGGVTGGVTGGLGGLLGG